MSPVMSFDLLYSSNSSFRVSPGVATIWEKCMFSRLSVLGGHEAFNITYEIYSIFCHCLCFNNSVLRGTL